MYYAGINAHNNYLTIAVVNIQGDLVGEESPVPIGDGEPLLAALEGPRPLEAVVETCPFWPWLHDMLTSTEIGFHLANANRLEAIASSKTKTDSVDASGGWSRGGRVLVAGHVVGDRDVTCRAGYVPRLRDRVATLCLLPGEFSGRNR